MLSSLLGDVAIGNILCSNLFWTAIVAIIGFKVYLVITTKMCPSRKFIYNKTAIVTGATSGIGREIAQGLVARGARVCLACRDIKKAEQLRDEILAKSDIAKSRLAVYHLDLSSLDSVRNFAKEVSTKEERIDILINNAGATGLGNKKTEDGIQIGMQVNYFAPFLLTCLLIEKMKKTAPSRIIWLTSKLHGCAKFDIEDLNFEKSFSESQVYFSSKLAIILAADELAKRLRRTGVTVNTVHPGFTYTPIWQHLPSGFFSIWTFILKKFFKTTFEASQTPLFLAADHYLEYVTGKYFVECQDVLPSSKAQDHILSMKLYHKSLDMVNLTPSFMEQQFNTEQT